jgi:hypothetical protein
MAIASRILAIFEAQPKCLRFIFLVQRDTQKISQIPFFPSELNSKQAARVLQFVSSSAAGEFYG